MSDLFKTGIRPAIDDFLQKKSEEERDYGNYWSASSAGYCMRKLIFDRLKVPHVKEQDARKTRVFEAGHIFHEYMQKITRDAGLSIAQEVELQDEDLMVRGHFDDLVLVVDEGALKFPPDEEHEEWQTREDAKHLILYDYKTQNSRAFTYQKGKPMSHYHKYQLGTYLYMLRKHGLKDSDMIGEWFDVRSVDESRIMKISKDDIRQAEDQLLWSPALEKEIYEYWSTLNGYWEAKTIPKCTCADHEGGFLAREAYNDFFYEDEPCSLKWMNKTKKEGLWQHPDEKK